MKNEYLNRSTAIHEKKCEGLYCKADWVYLLFHSGDIFLLVLQEINLAL